MSFDKPELLKVVKRYLSGKASDEEREFLEAYFDFFNHEDDVWDMFSSEEKDILHRKMKADILSKIEGEEEDNVHHIWSMLFKIAIVLIFCSLGGYFLIRTKTQNQALYQQPVQPGNKAILTLANGKKIVLDDSKEEVLNQENGITINKGENGELIYSIKKPNEDLIDQKLGFTNNTIETPFGGQYQVILSDGTHVWLNATSSLTFPTIFTGKERIVTLTGEGYFEVSKNKEMPFKVMINDNEVKVFGTHFNVMGYKDEESTKVSLLEGSVRVSNGSDQKMLTPGKQALIKDNISIDDFKGSEAIAWIRGDFSFNDEPIESVMRKISRSYNLEVVFQGAITKELFVGTIHRSKDLEETLSSLELTGLVKFKINGRRVTVMPK